MNVNKMILALSLVATPSIFGGSVAAQEGQSGSLDVETISAVLIDGQPIYSTKFICGLPPGPTGTSVGPVAAGLYFTAINIYNPNPFPVEFKKRAIITNSQAEYRGQIGDEVTETLQPNQGLEIECRDIKVLLARDPDAPLNETGFVAIRIITSLKGKNVVNLNVEGVWTANFFPIT